jgi:hypothetical protein
MTAAMTGRTGSGRPGGGRSPVGGRRAVAITASR